MIKNIMHADVLFPINAEAFTYSVPDELRHNVAVGSRVKVPFKRSEKIGVVVSLDRSASPSSDGRGSDKKEIVIRPVKSLLDEEPLIPGNILSLIKWTGQYYMSNSGLALKNAVPSSVLEGRKAGRARIVYDGDIKERKYIVLNAEQTAALEEINKENDGVFLVHGVTGSGKTEIYINAIKSLPDNKEAIVLVPEIAITAQMIERFRSCFGQDAVFYHSGMSAGERITAWHQMRQGDVRVVVGVRSAVFAPFMNLGLIVVDEEQEASYKQFEGLRYSARDVALARAKLEGIKVVLGSATPSVEAFYAAEKKKFIYIQLKERIDQKPLPEVEIIDMTRADKETFSFSNRLLDSLRENLSRGYQSLIMLNRRGYSPYFICTDCGHTYKCPACSITLIYHKDSNRLNCHYCGSYLEPKAECPGCGGTGVKHLGTGTQRIEEELHSLIPGLSFSRMDRDSTQKKLSHHRIVKQMEEKKLDVLLGTQMVAKGHDFPEVTLAAVVSADIALNMPDFRSAERSFQLFTQLAGRAGRGDAPGRALIQTYEPDNFVFDYVRNHDYIGFYRNEIELRKELSYPPFSKLIRIILSFRTKDDGKKIMDGVTRRIRKETASLGRAGVDVLGPSPAPVEKIRNLWRWHIILKGRHAKTLRSAASGMIANIKHIKGIKIDIDVDPIHLM